jgi:predicted CoA-binding protein
MQEGIINDEVACSAKSTGMKVVMDRCIMVDYLNLIPDGR